ncbi:MAG TPA: hypothetical protein VFX59_17745 [Polyangiales bacterium]|nr:hypothetical protein [Polyangiales bacterium]
MTLRSRLRLAIPLAIAAALPACGSGMTGGVLRARDYGKYLDTRNCFYGMEFFHRPPTREHAVVGTVELRTSRVKNATELQDELESLARELYADALVAPAATPKTSVEGSVNPLRPFYVFDDGRTQILEARAIRYAQTDCDTRYPRVR